MGSGSRKGEGLAAVNAPALLLAVVLLTPAPARAEPPDAADYTLTPVLDGDQLTALDVTMTFRGDADGETRLELPDAFAGQSELWRHLSDLRASGATSTGVDQAARVLRHSPGARVTVRYRVRSAYDATPTAYAKGGAIVRPDWVASFGEALFASVDGREQSPATVTFSGWPATWRIVSDLQHGGLGRPLTEGDVVESTLLAGPTVEVVSRPIPNGTLRLGMFGDFGFSPGELGDRLAGILTAQRRFWGDGAGPFTVTLYGLGPLTNLSSAGGTGRTDAFALEATPDLPLDFFTRLIAHEHDHSWIPRRLGRLPEVDEAADYWLSEGFNEFYTGRTLLSAGLWTPRQFADDLNETLLAFAQSPVRAEPNAVVVRDFWTDDAVQRLPYQRGWLFALLLDGRLRDASGGARSLDSLLRLMRDRWNAAPDGAKPLARDNFFASASAMDLPVADLFDRHIGRGEPIALPADLWGDCATIGTEERATFDAGFDRAESTRTGLIAGVDPNGPAYRAGLRDGMKRVAWVGSQEGDARAPMTYRVADDAGEREVTWLPAGEDLFTAQQARLGPDAESPRCRMVFAGRPIPG